jgi:hypothetical protein
MDKASSRCGLMPGIRVLSSNQLKGVDGRHKPGPTV